MNQSTYKLIVTLLVLIIVIGGGMLLYQNLGQNVDLDALTPTETVPDSTESLTESVSENPAPDVTIVDADGNEVKLSDFRGKGVVLNFWASWCGPCKSEMPHFQEAFETHGDEVYFVMVNMSTAFGDTRADAEKVLSDGGFTFPVYYDDKAECAYAYNVSAIPMTVFIDADGEIVSYKTGMISSADLERRILTITN